MIKLYRQIKKRLQSHKNSVIIEGITLTVFLITISFVMVINIFRVVNNGRSNYETFLSEQKSLQEITQKNQELNKENDFVSSDEYGKLVLRESGNYALEGESLFQTNEKPFYYQEEKQYFDLDLLENYDTWWAKLIKN